jgi:CRISPR-associated endonuclease/helicase Cas3
MSLSVDDFDGFHVAVHSKPPFAWQTRLLRQIVDERAWPRMLDLPTGAGKTTCIDIALFALALDAANVRDRWCPRRVAMVVDRRIVVDQVAERGRLLLSVLTDTDATPIVLEVANRLRSLSREDGEPIGVFTLRGGIPKDDGWARTPDQPLVLASTVDQFGSRLLIQGYGVSKGMKPVHAGLLANDTLLLLDEVHLSQPFAETLDALDVLRRKFAKTNPLASRFHHAFLSATPGASDPKRFHLNEDEKAPGSPLGPRLHASKRTRLREEADRTALERACVAEARTLIEAHHVVAVVVNRVASASTITSQLREALDGQVDVHLLTGRMRPLDRDDVLRALRPRIMTGRNGASGDRKLIVVGTQCIEVGADFDFDALVTEAASFDALRQRFGRVDRLGLYRNAEGVIVRDKSANDDDPVYGPALSATIKWLKDRLTKKTKQVDFGVLALPLPDEETLKDLAAPKPHAPVLLPAYLDLWMQSWPAARPDGTRRLARPVVVPDVSLWLHGPKSGPADVQVVWRTDLTEADLDEAFRAREGETARQRPIGIVAAIRPSSLEAMSLPFVAARRWLSGEDDVGDIADVEGSAGEDRESRPGRLALQWDGDDSAVITADDLRPGDTIVVPAARGGIRDGCFEPGSTVAVDDLAERASLFARGQPVLRLRADVLGQLGLSLPLDDLQETRTALNLLAEREPSGWRKLWLDAVAKSRAVIVVDAEEPWTVLMGKRIKSKALRSFLQTDDTVEDGLESTTDEDDSFHTGQPVSLSQHIADVESFARVYAAAAGLPEELVDDLALAGWLHDVGKADRRFQILLRGGSEIEFFKDETPWAKSGMPSGAKAAQRLAAKRSGYPRGARHEVQSVAMIEKHADVLNPKAHDIDLVLYLVASHHGHCRPFAPVAVDADPIEVVLSNHQSTAFGKVDFGPTSSKHELHRLDSPLADRFWRLVEKHGWQELCWLEAILRLADHRASELEQSSGSAT